MAMTFENILKAAREKAALWRLYDESRQLPTPRTIREPSSTEANASYIPVGYGELFCVHAKSLFDICTNCKRDKQIARLQYNRFCKRYELTV